MAGSLRVRAVCRSPVEEGRGEVTRPRGYYFDAPHRLGDRVVAQNYRTPGGTWEPGEIIEVVLRERYRRGFHISYEVELDRKSDTGRRLTLHLSCDQVRK